MNLKFSKIILYCQWIIPFTRPCNLTTGKRPRCEWSGIKKPGDHLFPNHACVRIELGLK